MCIDHGDMYEYKSDVNWIDPYFENNHQVSHFDIKKRVF